MLLDILAYILPATLIGLGVWEGLAYIALGPLKEWDDETHKWLNGDIHLSRIDNDLLYRKYHGSNIFHLINFIKVSKPTIFSKYYVDKPDGKTFRVLRNSPLHQLIEKKHKQLLRIRQ